MCEAYRLGSRIWSGYSSPFSRHDYALAQLFACLVVREMLKLSYRKTEAFLGGVKEWLADIGLDKAPDHNTLWRAFGFLIQTKRADRMLDLMAESVAEQGDLKLPIKPLAIDSSCYEPRHRSRHYDRVCRKMQLGDGEKYANRPEKTAKQRQRQINRSRSKKARHMPKLAIAVASGCHFILAARACTGSGSDAPDFAPLLRQSRLRAKVKTVVADAGYDSEKNHCIARLDLGVRSIIPPKIGKPTRKLPTGRFRKSMKHRFARKADAKMYGQRSQSETVNSMMKRNLGDELRSILDKRRRQEMLLRALTHNLMLLCKIQG